MWPFSLLPIPPLPPLPPERTWYPHICKLDPYNPTIDQYWYLPHNGVSIDSAPSPVHGLAARLVMWLSAVLPVSRDTKSTLDRVVAWLVPSTVLRDPTTYELDACMYVFKPAGPIYTHPTFLWIIQVVLTIIALYYLLDIVDKLCNVLVAFIAQSGEDGDATAPTRHIAPAVATAPDHDAWPPSSASPAEDFAPSLAQESPPSLAQDSTPSLEQGHSPSPSPSPTPLPAQAPDTTFTVPLQSQARKRRRAPSPDVQQARHRSWLRTPPPSPLPSRSESPIPPLLPVSLYSSPAPSSPSPSPPPTYSPAPQQTQASIADLPAAWDASSHAQTRPRMVTPTSTCSLSSPASLDGRLPLSARSLPRRARSLDTAREAKSLSKPGTDAEALDLATEDRIVEAHEHETIVVQPALVGGNTEACDGVEAPDAPPFQPTPELTDDAQPSIQTVDATTVPLPDSADDDLEDVTPSSSALEPVTPAIVASGSASHSSPIVASASASNSSPSSAPHSAPALPPTDDSKAPSVTTIEQERAEAVQPTTVLVTDPPEQVVENTPIDDGSAPSVTSAASAPIVSSNSPAFNSLPPTASVTTIEQESAEAAVLVAVVDPPAPVIENNPLVDPATFYTLDDGDAHAASSSSRSGAKTPAPIENNPWIDPRTAWDDIDPPSKPQALSMHQVLPVVRRSQHQTLPGDPIPAPKPQGRWSKQENFAQQQRKGPPTARGRGRGRGPQHGTPDRSALPRLAQQQQPSQTPGAGPSTLSLPPPAPPHASGFAQGQSQVNHHTAHPKLPIPVNQAPPARSNFDAARSRNSQRAQQPHHVLAFDTPETYAVPSTTSDPAANSGSGRQNGEVKRRKAAAGGTHLPPSPPPPP